MNCPICNGKTIVSDVRKQTDCINRRRKCVKCGHRFSTVEIDKDFYKKQIKRKDNQDA